MSDRIRRCPTTPAPAPIFTAQEAPPLLEDLSVLGTPESMAYLADSSGGSGGPKASDPLHDVHCRIDGPAARDLLTTFHLRWEHHPDSAAVDRRSPLRGGRSTPRPAPKTSSPPSASSTGATCTVAIARTFNPVTKARGIPKERDIRNLLLGAIGAARRFIYMEEQYLVSLEAARALNAAVRRLEHLTILIGATQVVTDTPCIWTFRRDFVDTVTRGLSARDAAKVRVFRLATPPNPSPLPPCGGMGISPIFGTHTYVHAKAWFFDDELAVIGSANCNRRGWQHDSEVDAFIYDDARPTGSQLSFCQKARMDLWAEHLNAPASRFADGVASAGLWLAPPPGARVLRYCPNEDTDGRPIPAALCGDRVRDGLVDPPAP
jgi:phosphatidylserine/phosphatidylglycerophosphate/cardiolipin synthase-like enzyme